MTPFKLLTLVVTIAALIGATGAWWVQAQRYTAQISQMRAAHSEALQKQSEQRRQAEHDLQDAVAMLDAATEAGRQSVQTVTQVVEKEVVRYESRPDPEFCRLDTDWVRHHDTATLSDLPQNSAAASLPDDPTQAVTDARALRVVTENYRQCVEDQGRIVGLQNYVNTLLAELERYQAPSDWSPSR